MEGSCSFLVLNSGRGAQGGSKSLQSSKKFILKWNHIFEITSLTTKPLGLYPVCIQDTNFEEGKS